MLKGWIRTKFGFAKLTNLNLNNVRVCLKLEPQKVKSNQVWRVWHVDGEAEEQARGIGIFPRPSVPQAHNLKVVGRCVNLQHQIGEPQATAGPNPTPAPKL
jgi:hypothetical protein